MVTTLFRWAVKCTRDISKKIIDLYLLVLSYICFLAKKML